MRSRKDRTHHGRRAKVIGLAAFPGWIHLGGKESTMLDPEGNELVLEDRRLDAFVFKVKGRRAVRAKILMDETGRMQDYIPA